MHLKLWIKNLFIVLPNLLSHLNSVLRSYKKQFKINLMWKPWGPSQDQSQNTGRVFRGRYMRMKIETKAKPSIPPTLQHHFSFFSGVEAPFFRTKTFTGCSQRLLGKVYWLKYVSLISETAPSFSTTLLQKRLSLCFTSTTGQQYMCVSIHAWVCRG